MSTVFSDLKLGVGAAPEKVAAANALVPQGGPFGSGVDGSVTLGAGTTTLTSDKHYQNLVVPAGSTLATAGYKVFVSETLSGAGTISNNGAAAADDVAGAGAAGVTVGVASANGGAGNQAAGSAGSAATPSLGGSGGAGGAGVSAAGALGAATAPLGGVVSVYDPMLAALPFVTKSDGTWARRLGGAGGGGGGGDNAAVKGGGGGGGGGIVFVAAKTWAFTGTVSAVGGAGGAGSGAGGNTGGGGGGGGGAVIRLTRTDSVSPTVTVAGGAKGSKGAAGADGSAGSAGNVIVVPV